MHEVFLHSVTNGNDVSLDPSNTYRVTIGYLGNVQWVPFFNWVTSCDMDLFYFPFDTQVHLVFIRAEASSNIHHSQCMFRRPRSIFL